MRSEYDFIVVGSGSAGCVVAEALSRDSSTRVLVIEAGPRDLSPMIHMPAGMQSLMENTKYNWAFRTVPQRHLNNRQLYIPQGKVIGGTSSINGMIYIRGSRQDYDGWAARGCYGWSYKDVLPVFKALESNARIHDEYHGTDGPLNVTDFGHYNPLNDAFLAACVELGVPLNPDFNGRQQYGAGRFQARQWSRFRKLTKVAEKNRFDYC